MLIHASRYGKCQVRLTRLDRSQAPHRLVVCAVSIELEGAFERSYTDGDNRLVVATDSIKNTVYVLARELGIETIEDFGLALARHFVGEYEQVRSAKVAIEQEGWQPLEVGGQASPTAFERTGPEVARVSVTIGEAEDCGSHVVAGLDHLQVMKTSDSGFADFVRDRFTTLGDTDDRILATTVESLWTYDSLSAPFAEHRATVREALVASFAAHQSLSVQQTLYAMAQAALDAVPAIERITLRLPNQHHLLVDLSPFDLDNHNQVFVPTSEPFGLIEATLERG